MDEVRSSWSPQPCHYTLDNNDMRFTTAQGFNCSDQLFTYLRDTFDILYAEGETAPKMAFF